MPAAAAHVVAADDEEEPMGRLPSAAAFPKTSLSLKLPLIPFLAVSAVLLVLAVSAQGELMGLVTLLCLGSIYRVDSLSQWVMGLDEGSDAMRKISEAIREGSTAFFQRVYGTIFRLSLPVAGLLVFTYAVRVGGDLKGTTPLSLAVSVGLTFLAGAGSSALAGFVGLWISVHANVRVTASAVRLGNVPGSPHPVTVALMAGCVAATVVVALVVLGLSVLFSVMRVVFPGVPEAKTPLLLVGYGFGASFVALFAQLGGGIFTKAADVGADLVGKLEQGIPEDDARNPAVVADLVGDNVGDCAARGADLFESIAAEVVSSMILGGSLGEACGLSEAETRGLIMFPLLVHALDLVVSGLGVAAAARSAVGATADAQPIAILKRGQRVAAAAACVGLLVSTRALLNFESAPHAWWHFFLCALVGNLAGHASIMLAEYYTDVPHEPVQSIIRASEMGHATNIIAGLSVGLTSTGPSVALVGSAILASYWLGQDSGLTDSASRLPLGGLYGTAVATMGCLSSAAYVLAMDVFGPIADNAGGIAEMSHQTEAVRDITDKCDAVGNSTKAATKAFALSSATLASFLLLRAFMDEVESLSGREFKVVDITAPEVFVSGLVGGALVFVFAGFAISAVGQAAGDVVKEVRRQFAEIPGIMEGTGRPDYGACVDIVAAAGLKLMIKPGCLAVGTPVAVGLVFRVLGDARADPLLGAKAVVGLMVATSSTGMLMGLFLSNTGGASDNCKKGIEAGALGGKGSKAHQAAVTGDTVGDPLKDTAGPSLHVVIKLVSTVALVLTPLFCGAATAGGK